MNGEKPEQGKQIETGYAGRELAESLATPEQDTFDKEAFDQLMQLYGREFTDGIPRVEEVVRHIDFMYEKSEPLTPDDGDRPEMTICIPVALLGEDQTRVLKTLESIQQAANKKYKVILWFNYDSNTGKKQEVIDKYQQTQNAVKSLDLPNLQIVTARDSSSYGMMTNVREAYMQAVVADCYHNQYPADHPVLWLDADTTFVAPGSLEDIAASVKSLDAFFVHANTQYSIDWAEGEPTGDLDSETKAVLVNEIQRRQSRRDLDETKVYDGSVYPEECGLAFAVGTYMLARNVQPPENSEVRSGSGYNESVNFIQRISAYAASDKFLAMIKYLAKKEGLTSGSMPVIKAIKSARIGTSARRHYANTKEKGIAGLVDPDASGYGGLATRRSESEASHDFSQEGMLDLVDQKNATNTPELTPKQLKRQNVLKRVVNKLFP